MIEDIIKELNFITSIDKNLSIADFFQYNIFKDSTFRIRNYNLSQDNLIWEGLDLKEGLKLLPEVKSLLVKKQMEKLLCQDES